MSKPGPRQMGRKLHVTARAAARFEQIATGRRLDPGQRGDIRGCKPMCTPPVLGGVEDCLEQVSRFVREEVRMGKSRGKSSDPSNPDPTSNEGPGDTRVV